MKTVTICFPIKNSEILLGMKKRGFGEGKWNGFGGKVGKEESILHAACRETKEECGLDIEENNLEKVAELDFFEEKEHLFNCHIFFTRKWGGVEDDSEEMHPQWFSLESIPYENMWVDDKEWLPVVLSGKKIRGEFHFKKGMADVESFDWKEL